MKQAILFIISVLCMFTVGCTSQEGVLKKQAKSMGEKKMMAAIRMEADEMLKGSEVLHGGYIDFMRMSSEVNVAEVKIHNEQTATVTVTMTSLPIDVRRTVLEIAAKVDGSKSRRFNFREAANLVRKQNGGAEAEVQPLGVYSFRKEQDKWVQE